MARPEVAVEPRLGETCYMERAADSLDIVDAH
jgi:hypothetical protein